MFQDCSSVGFYLSRRLHMRSRRRVSLFPRSKGSFPITCVDAVNAAFFLSARCFFSLLSASHLANSPGRCFNGAFRPSVTTLSPDSFIRSFSFFSFSHDGLFACFRASVPRLSRTFLWTTLKGNTIQAQNAKHTTRTSKKGYFDDLPARYSALTCLFPLLFFIEDFYRVVFPDREELAAF